MNDKVKSTAAMIGGIGAGIGTGALLMYLFDPERGRTRRALIRDKAVGTSNNIKKSVTRTASDLKNRAQGAIHEAGSLLTSVSSEVQKAGSDVRKKALQEAKA